MQTLEFPLKERTQAGNGGVRAVFVVDNGRVVGAFMVLDGYTPGVVSLTYRRDFAPPGLSPEHLVFEDVKSVEIMGPWHNGSWGKRAVLRDPLQVRRFLAMLTASTARKGARWGTMGDEDFMISINYRGGIVVLVDMVTKRTSGMTTFFCHAFPNWHYLPPTRLKAYVKSVLGNG